MTEEEQPERDLSHSELLVGAVAGISATALLAIGLFALDFSATCDLFLGFRVNCTIYGALLIALATIQSALIVGSALMSARKLFFTAAPLTLVFNVLFIGRLVGDTLAAGH